MLALSLAAALLAAPVPPVALDAAHWAELSAASASAHALPDERDSERFRRADHWEVADGSGGDCEDKALFARARLLAQGWPPAALRVALLWTETHDYHAVLTIDVVHHGLPATYVIDPRFPWVVGWDALTRLGYRWDRRLAATGGGWTKVAMP